MTHDDFESWDAAYVLGALPPAERRQYEEHLRGCERCSASVAELAGMPGLLSRVPRDAALALLETPTSGEQEAGETHAGAEPGPGPELLPSLLHTARRRRRVSRWLVASVSAVTAAAVVVVLAFVLPAVLPRTAPSVEAERVVMQQVEPSAVTADLRLVSEPWGTRIESRCTYAHIDSEYGQTWTYAMVVTDRQGRETQISTWSAAEGTTAVPTATTSVPLTDIASVDIRTSGDGTVLLRSTFG